MHYSIFIGVLETRIDSLEVERKKSCVSGTGLSSEDYGLIEILNKQNQVYKVLLRKNMQSRPLAPLHSSKLITENKKNAELNMQCRKLYQ